MIGNGCSNRQRQNNGIIAALFLFQYSLLVPFMKIFSLSFLLAVSGIVLVIAAFYVNRGIVFNIKVIILFFALLIIFLLKNLIDGSEISVLIKFLMIAIPPVIVYSYQFDYDMFLKWSCILSKANFLFLFLTPFSGERIAYMRFGYSMVLTVIFSYISVFHPDYVNPSGHNGYSKTSARIIDIGILVVSVAETIVFGSRGALVVFVAFVFIDLLLIYKKRVLLNTTLMIAGFITLFNLEQILSLVISLTARFNINSYALNKYQYQLVYGLEEASSGRGRLYATAWESIKENLLFGTPMISYDEGELYTHNLFLQVGKDLGIIAMILMAFFVLYCLYLMYAKRLDKKEKSVLAVLFVMSVVRLLLSSNLWERPEFWMLVSFVLNYRTLTPEKRMQDEHLLINQE